MGKQKLVNLRERAEADVTGWNSCYPVGQLVDVRLDSGEIRRTKTRSNAEVLLSPGVPCAVIWVHGIAGCYLLTRVTAVDEPAKES